MDYNINARPPVADQPAQPGRSWRKLPSLSPTLFTFTTLTTPHIVWVRRMVG